MCVKKKKKKKKHALKIQSPLVTVNQKKKKDFFLDVRKPHYSITFGGNTMYVCESIYFFFETDKKKNPPLFFFAPLQDAPTP